jgi:hypothetical protein
MQINKIFKMILIVIIFIQWVYSLEFSVPIVVSDGTYQDTLIIGIHPQGSDGYDAGLDVYSPPLPPGSAFGSLLEWNFEQYYTDIRDNSHTEKTFKMKYQPSSGSAIVINWDSTGLSDLGSFIIEDWYGVSFSLDMTTTNTFDIFSEVSLTERLKIKVIPNEDIIIINDAQSPIPPTRISPQNGSTVTDLTPTFTWTQETNATCYKIQVDTDSNFYSPKINEITTTTNYTSNNILTDNGIYYWRVRSEDNNNFSKWSPVWSFSIILNSIVNENLSILSDYVLGQNFPNPFNPSTTIQYSIPKNSKVDVSIYTLAGKKIKTLVNKNQTPGNYQVTWNGANHVSGVYIYKIKADKFVQFKKMLLVR